MNEAPQSEPSTTNSPLPFLFVGDHLAIDLLNTVYKTAAGTLIDSLNSDGDALRWLARAGWPTDSRAEVDGDGSLIKATKQLRGAIRSIVETNRSGQPISAGMLAPLNRFLSQSRSHLELRFAADESLHLHRHWMRKNAEEILAPIAESAAQLFASPDFSLIKHCEDTQCVLWFVDRTKSHHRRWCSMAICGNRNKVAAYRQRKQRQA